MNMKRGKHICNTLKEIRLRVARENNIEYSPTECHHEGDCAGTCPKCEAEVRYIEQQLAHIRRFGRKVAVAGIGASVAALSSCSLVMAGKMTPPKPLGGDVENVDIDETEGYLAEPDDTVVSRDKAEPKSGVVQTDTIKEPVLLGDVVEEQPRFPGGIEGLMQFLSDNVKYPPECVKDSIGGRVVVSFVVEKDGTITEPKVVKSVHPLLDAEALRVVGLMPKWQPGMMNGERRRMKYTIPVNFKL